MKDFFNKNNTRKGGKKFGDSARQSMHRATCSKCNSQCEVPFRPNGKKPIYCNDCFRKEDGGAQTSRFGAKKFERSGSFEKPEFRSLPQTDNNDEVVKQLKALNVKMDLLLQALADNKEFEDDDEENDE